MSPDFASLHPGYLLLAFGLDFYKLAAWIKRGSSALMEKKSETLTVRRSIKLAPVQMPGEWMFFYSYRASVKHSIGDIEGAMADYTLAITKFPDSQTSYTDRGNFKELLGDFKGAEMDFLEAEKIGKKRLIEEMASLTRALEKNPSDADSLYKRSGIKMDLEDYAGAIKDLDKAIQIQPHNS